MVGTRGTNTLEMAAAYAAIANEGVYRNPSCIEKITTAAGEILVADEIEEKRVYQADASLMMTDILQSVIDSAPGTARGCKLSNQPAAAKTGTTTDNTDGWLCGYTPYYTTAVWVGQDQVKKVSGLSGSSYPAYIWKAFMNEIHDDLPRKNFDKYTGNLDEDPYYNSETETETESTDMTASEVTSAVSTETSGDTSQDTTTEADTSTTASSSEQQTGDASSTEEELL